jgi:hypothetical protein
LVAQPCWWGGESEEEKAQNAVCDARADIEKRVDHLAEAKSERAGPFVAEQGDLEPERRQDVEEAGKRFRSQLQTTAKDFVSGATSGEEAGASLGSALDELAKSFSKAYAPVDCA